MTLNHQIVLDNRPQGEATVSNFKMVEAPIPALQDGQVLVRHHYMSLDPYMRGRMNESKSYAQPQPLGEVMIAGTVGEVVESQHPKFKVGDQVVGMGGWQEYSVVDANVIGALRKVDTTHVPLSHYLGADVDDTNHRIAVLDRMVREQAFTVLNRLAALLMMEARGQLIESVSKGYQSRGYQLYSKIAGTALGETGQAYQVYLFSVFDELAQELPALFDRYAANGLLFPRETALRALLDELNHFEIEPLWAADETIGWIYQYFNSKEERKAMRPLCQTSCRI